MSRQEMQADIVAFFPSWYWSVMKRAARSLLDAPTARQKALWRVFQTAWIYPVTLRAKWLVWRYAA